MKRPKGEASSNRRGVSHTDTPPLLNQHKKEFFSDKINTQETATFKAPMEFTKALLSTSDCHARSRSVNSLSPTDRRLLAHSSWYCTRPNHRHGSHYVMSSSKAFTIPHGKVWLRPDEAYLRYQEQMEGLSFEEVEYNGRYKSIRELRDLAVFGLALYKAYGQIFMVQMNEQDPSPDAFLLQQDEGSSTANIAAVEMTYYGRNKLGLPKESLLDRLTARGGKFEKPSKYTILIHIGRGLEVDHQSITDELQKRSATFNVFSIQETSSAPDTMLSLVIYNPELAKFNINIGEAVNELANSDTPGVITQMRGKPKERTEN